MNILITGGASGVGSAITRQLAKGGAHKVFFSYCHSAEAAKALEKESSNTKGIFCDFSKPASVNAFLEELPRINPDILVNNALTGIRVQHFHKMEAETFLEGFQSNVLPVIKITQAAIQIFRKKKLGRIITILTAYVLNRPPMGLSEYVAAKAYLASLSKSWAVENAAFNIASNCISPSFMRTNMTRDTDERIIEEMESKAPLKKLLEPADVAAAVQYLVDATPHINGSNLIMNGASDVI